MPSDIANTPIFDPSDIAFICDASRPILTHGRVMVAGGAMRPHDHPRCQLLWAMRGVFRVAAGSDVWTVPPSHAVWIPGGMAHEVIFETETEMLNLYVDPSVEVPRPAEASGRCAVVLLTPLARELILRLGATDTSAPFDSRLQRLCGVILDELQNLPEAALNLPSGSDPRLTRVTRHLIASPSDMRPLAELAEIGLTSSRTLERLFRNETGLSFRKWRSRLRLLTAIEGLNRGESTSTLAWTLGYRSTSAFVAAFREQFGKTPQRFLERGQA